MPEMFSYAACAVFSLQILWLFSGKISPDVANPLENASFCSETPQKTATTLFWQRSQQPHKRGENGPYEKFERSQYKNLRKSSNINGLQSTGKLSIKVIIS